MDEDNYTQTYQRINSAPCAFEKDILSLKCQCDYQHLFNLADRHGVGCTDSVHQQNALNFLTTYASKPAFYLKLLLMGRSPITKKLKYKMVACKACKNF